MNAPTFQTRRGAAIYAATVGSLLQAHHGVVFTSLGVITTAEGYEPEIKIDSATPGDMAHPSQARLWMCAIGITARHCLGCGHEDALGVLSPRDDIEFWEESGSGLDPVEFIQEAYRHAEQNKRWFGRDIVELAQLIESGHFISDAELRAQLVGSGGLA